MALRFVEYYCDQATTISTAFFASYTLYVRSIAQAAHPEVILLASLAPKWK